MLDATTAVVGRYLQYTVLKSATLKHFVYLGYLLICAQARPYAVGYASPSPGRVAMSPMLLVYALIRRFDDQGLLLCAVAVHTCVHTCELTSRDIPLSKFDAV